ncbi:MAG: lipopolysaccharide transport periplasmic protein LptA [Moraxellaceae bacterium]|nr:lipopolysaccharide transport periplasmic protein LptA [Moraxellaceae bacterium]MDP1776311.1 lipopolysaccharide transport periplasmic protein LptA [Moraxellaceae bacterium]
MHRTTSVLFAMIIGLTLPTTAIALPADRNQQVEITANNARFDERAGEAVYRGNVLVKQGTMEVRGDSLILNVDDKGALTLARTIGKPARFQQQIDPSKGLVKGEANEVIFDNRDGSVTLTGNAVLRQDNASFSGPRIVYSTTRKQIEASGNDTQRVQLIFPPSIRESSGKTQ